MKSTDKIIDYLKKTYQPESIIVYGSFADGSANLNSDFDTLIIAGKERMEDKKILLDNIDKIHTTEMGIDRIKRNLKIDTADVVEYCKNKVLDKNCNIYKQGKNWYCEVENIKITINSYSYTIITAHIVK